MYISWYKKFFIYSCSVCIILELISFSSSAKLIFKDDICSLEATDFIKYNNLSISDSDVDDGLSYAKIQNISEPAFCEYKISDVKNVTVSFYHTLGTIASNYKYGSDKYIALGFSGKYCNKSEKFHRVKFCPDDDSLYTKIKNGGWMKCEYSEDHDAHYLFREIDIDDEKSFTDKLVDYGVNIYISKDGENFERLKTKIRSIQKIYTDESDPEDDAMSEYATPSYCEKISSHIPAKTKYIKVELNNIHSIEGLDEEDISGDLWTNMLLLEEVNLEIDENSSIRTQSSDDTYSDTELTNPSAAKISRKRSKSMPIGISDFSIASINNYKLARDSSKRRDKFITFGTSNYNNVDDNVIYIPSKRKLIKRRQRGIYRDTTGNNKNKKGQHISPNSLSKAKNLKELCPKVYQTNNAATNSDLGSNISNADNTNEKDGQEKKSHKRSKRRKRRSPTYNLSDNKFINSQEDTEDTYVDGAYLEVEDSNPDVKNITKSDGASKSSHNNTGLPMNATNEHNIVVEQEKEEQTQKVLGTTYISSLLVALGSILTWDKFPILKKLFKMD